MKMIASSNPDCIWIAGFFHGHNALLVFILLCCTAAAPPLYTLYDQFDLLGYLSLKLRLRMRFEEIIR